MLSFISRVSDYEAAGANYPAVCTSGDNGCAAGSAAPEEGKAIMDSGEAQARAIIAAALIVRGAVEVPSIPPDDDGLPDAAGLRLRDLTEYLYRLITTDGPREPV